MGTTALRDVELVTEGTWAASTGSTTITGQDLAAMVTAFTDHVVDRPIVKIGHEDDGAMNEALKDGEPAYGWIENVAVGDGSAKRPNRKSLYGDLVGMPAKLAEVVPAAFRRRSVEIAWGVKTSAGKKYAAVLTAVALLGAAKPAVKGLADLLALYSDTGVAAAEAVDAVLIEDPHDTRTIPPQNPAGGHGDDVDTDTTNKEHLMPKLTKKAILELVKDVKDEDELTDEQLKALGITTPAEPTDVDGQAVIPGTPAPATPATPAAAPAAPVVVETQTKTAATAAPDGPETVTITKAMWEETQTKLSEASTVTTEVTKTRRDGIVTTAFREGRITKDEQKSWRDALDRDEQGTVTLLSGLTPRFSTTEIGSDQAPAATEFTESDQKIVDAFVGDFAKNFG